MKKLKVHNPDNLSTIAYSKLVDFQGDLKHEIEPKELMKMRNSLIKHGVFLPKAIWFDPDGKANILDGHQTKKALASLEADGWEIPEIPYITINAKDRKDAAEKLLQINSRYAKMNPDTTWLAEMEFDVGEIDDLIGSIEVPELSDNYTSLAQDKENKKQGSNADYIEENYIIVIECKDEFEQRELLEKLEREGIKCKALIS